MAINRKIVEYFMDENYDWIATLDCGHRQHVKSTAPWYYRPWLASEQSHYDMLGTQLECQKCSAHYQSEAR